MKATEQPNTSNKEEIYTFIAIPIEALKQSSEQGVQSLRVAQNVILKALPDGNITQQLQPGNKGENLIIRALTKNGNKKTIVNKANNTKPNSNLFVKVPGKVNSIIQNAGRPSVIEQNKNNKTSDPIRKSVISVPEQNTVPKANSNNKSEIRYLRSNSSQHLNKQNAKKDIEEQKCAICGDIFKKIMLYRKHMLMHRNSKKFKCQLCSASFNVEDNLKLHMAIHNKGDPTCPICLKKFHRGASLKSHMINHQVEETSTCAECLAEFDNEEEYNKHVESHKKEDDAANMQKVCSFCSQVFQDQNRYKEHVSYHIKVRKMMKGKKSRKRIGFSKDPLHKCHVCGKTFAKYCLLERHQRIHSGDRPFACHLCDRAFTQKGTLQIHIARHQGIKPYACTLCPAAFCQKGNLRVHVQKTHTIPTVDEKVYRCTMCNCIFRRVSSLNTHITRAHAGDKSDDISDIMEQLKQLEKHLGPKNKEELKAAASKIDIPRLTSKVKEKTSYSDSEDDGAVKYVKLVDSSIEGTVRRYVVKQRKLGEHAWYICSYCSKEFKKPSDLIRHIRVHTREKPFKCKECDQCFSLKSTLTTHAATHIGKRQFECIACSKSFTSMRTLNGHLRKHDTGSAKAIQTYKCTICYKVFNSPERVDAHMEIHKRDSDRDTTLHVVMQQPMMETANGLLPVAAPRRRKQYSETEALKRRHKCQCCAAAFVKGMHLKRHMLIHSGEKKHNCDICLKSFYSKYLLNEHLKFHTDERNFSCKICGKKFFTNAILKRHMIIHSSFKPYVCPYCKKRFKTVLLCRKHINTHKKEISFQMNALRETGELSKAEIEETVVEMDLHKKPSGEEQENEPFNNFSNNPEMIKKINLNDAAKHNLEMNKAAQQSKTDPVPKILFTDENGIVISTIVDPAVEQMPTELQNIDQNILQSIQNFQDRSTNLTLLSEATNDGDFINLEETIANLAQENISENNDIEYPRAFINYDELQTFSNSNLYNTCLSQLKINDPLLMSNVGDVQDSSILFSTDPSLNQIGDIQLDPQTLETLIPLPITNLNNVSFSTNSLNAFPNIILSNTPADNTDINQMIALPSISEISKKTHVNLSSFNNIIISGDKNYNNKLDMDLNDDGIVMDITQINQDGMLLPNLLYNTIQLEQDSIIFAGDKSNFENIESLNSVSILDSTNDISDINLICKICKQNLSTLKELKLHNCNKKSKMIRTNKKKKGTRAPSIKRKPKIIQGENEALSLTTEPINNDKEGNTDPNSFAVKRRREKIIQYECTTCDKAFISKASFNRHMGMHKEKMKVLDKPCGFCGKTFKKQSDLERHTRTHTGEKPFCCDKCDKKFSLKSTLESHSRTHNPSGNKDFYCPVCSSYFSSKSSLRVHMLVHTGVKPYQCSLCPEKFRTSGHRKSHMAFHLNANNERQKLTKINDILSSIVMDSQTIMPMSVDNNENVEMNNVLAFPHPQATEFQDCTPQILQEPEKDLLYPHQPMQVNPLFLQFNNMLVQDSGNGELPPLIQLDINTDGQITNMKSMLNNNGIDGMDGFGNHLYEPLVNETSIQEIPDLNSSLMKLPTTRNFECDICHKKYTTKSVLTKHKKRHLIKSFKCTECDSEFITQTELNNHLKIHMGYRPFYCEYCTNSFAERKNLKAHMKRIHGINLN